MPESEEFRRKVDAENTLLSSTAETDFDFQRSANEDIFHRVIQNMIRKFQGELEMVIKQESRFPMKHHCLDLLEVMCSPHSELVAQTQALGGKAQRWSLEDGDLSTVQGRRKLFQVMVRHVPKNLWYSPMCGPWSKFSNLNMGKSLQGLHQVLQKRRDSLWQISLGIVMFRFQARQQQHFHLEQPDGSAMLKLPSCGEIMHQTECCQFDLCRLGGLKDPLTSLPIRKRLQVQSTSQALHREVHGKTCNQKHEHKQIAGSTMVGRNRMAMTAFTENYPKKFARQIAKIILYDVSKECPTYAIRDQPDTPTENEHPTKNRRLGNKMSRTEIEQRFGETTWRHVMSLADHAAPRVGNVVLESGEIIQQVQKLCPSHVIHHVVLCRGTDRYQGPTCQMPPGTAPLRRRICIRRRHEDIHIDNEWESWEKFTYKGLRCKGEAARVSLTVFASAKHVIGQTEPDDVPAVANPRTQPENSNVNLPIKANF